MNMQNKSNIYTIYNAAPPSYAEATGAPASETHDLQFEQGYPHAVASSSPSAPFPYPYPPNCYPDSAPVQSAYSPVQPAYPEYVSAEWQSQPTDVTYRRTFIRGTREDKSKLK